MKWIKKCGNNERKFYGVPAKKGFKEEWCGTEKSYIEE